MVSNHSTSMITRSCLPDASTLEMTSDRHPLTEADHDDVELMSSRPGCTRSYDYYHDYVTCNVPSVRIKFCSPRNTFVYVHNISFIVDSNGLIISVVIICHCVNGLGVTTPQSRYTVLSVNLTPALACHPMNQSKCRDNI